MDLKRPLNWLKSKITEIEENLNETKTLSKVKCVQVSCKKCLLLNVFIIENSVVGGNVNWDRQMSVIKRPLHRGFVMRVSVISSVPEKIVDCREVSAIKDVRCKEVSL